MENKSVEDSRGVNNSFGVNSSKGVNGSEGVNWSQGVNGSEGVNGSGGVNFSNGVNHSNGISYSKGVNRSEGVNYSFGIMNCYAVDKALFLADKTRSFSIFGVEVSEERFDEVKGNLDSLLDGWFPRFNNAFELLEEAKRDWSKVEASDIKETLEGWDKQYEAWEDMPQEAIKYVRSLPEFDEKMFARITGMGVIKSSKVENRKIKLVEKVNKLLAKANKLIEKANKLIAET